MLPASLQEALANENFDALESEWLTFVTERPEDLDVYLKVADLLIGSEGEDRLRSLLELLDEQLVEAELWDERLRLIRHAGKHYLKTGSIFETVIESVRGLYSDRSEELEVLLPTVGLDKGRDDTPKLWDKVERLRNLFAYRVGTVVHMADKGVGEIVDVNLELQTLKVDFEQFKGLSVGFRAAGKMLDILDPSHVLHRKLEEPEALAELDPPELLRVVLQSFGRPLTGAEVKQAVSGLVPSGRWSSWWTAARKHPQVVTEPGKRQTYHWAESSEHAQASQWQTFLDSDTRTRLDLLRKTGSQDPELQARMVETLLETAAEARSEDSALAFEIWQHLDRIGAAPEDWTAHTLIEESRDPVAVVRSLETRTLREAAYRTIAEARDDSAELLQRALSQETDARALDLLADLLMAEGGDAWDRAVDQTLSQPRKAPAAFTWLAERAGEDEALRQRRGARLLKQTLAALSDDNFSSFHTRLEHLGETGGSLPRILTVLTEEEAGDAERVIKEAVGLPDYQRKPLLTALHLRFPHLEGVREEPLYATAESLEAKREELRQLLEEEIPTNRKAIETAREMGDLRENFEYKAARQRHEYLASRATSLNEQLARARVLDPKTIDTSKVRIGTAVRLTGDGGERTLTILGPWESDPEQGVISHESDLARELLGHEVGDQVQIGDDALTVESITTYDA
jgi:transcription elongation GreA/GreB family factor